MGGEEKKRFKSFEELEWWNACREVMKFITQLLKKYPRKVDLQVVSRTVRGF
jgi:hypothetical protein